jgi:hypothetical protein
VAYHHSLSTHTYAYTHTHTHSHRQRMENKGDTRYNASAMNDARPSNGNFNGSMSNSSNENRGGRHERMNSAGPDLDDPYADQGRR